MILNTGGRTDTVQYYTPWLLKRFEAGFVYSRNPLFPNKVTRYELLPDKVDGIQFCSKDYEPILEHLPAIIVRFNTYFHYTITAYGKDVEPGVPSIAKSMDTLKRLSAIVGKQRVAWRYDPLLLTEKYTIGLHLQTFEQMARELSPYVDRCIFSFVEMYKKLEVNMPELIPSARFNRQFGNAIPDSLYTPNFMTPHFTNHRSGKLINPNHYVEKGKTSLIIDGVKLEIYTIPGESPDHLAIWLPERGVLFCGDNVYGCFPNIYPIRGGVYRDVERWAKGVRRLLDFNAKSAMCGHNLVLKGNEVKRVLTDYAEAIEYVYNATVKGMNEGKTPEELCEEIELPKYLQGKSYLGEFYGAIDWTIKSIYAAKLGWFDGNPTHLFPLTTRQEAERMATLAGGEPQLIASAQKALADKDYQWAMKLADYLLALGKEDGKIIKIKAMREKSKQVLPISGINYLMQSSLEMQNK